MQTDPATERSADRRPRRAPWPPTPASLGLVRAAAFSSEWAVTFSTGMTSKCRIRSYSDELR